MAMGIMQKALDGVKSRKDTTPTLDAQVVELPAENENEKQIIIKRPDNNKVAKAWRSENPYALLVRN